MKYKVIAGAARNYGHSFTSITHYVRGGPAMCFDGEPAFRFP